ncbi:hypothetical protein D3C84_394920 [compost metagenome]
MGSTLFIQQLGVITGFTVQFAKGAALFDDLDAGKAIGADVALLLVELRGLLTRRLQGFSGCGTAASDALERPAGFIDGVEQHLEL